MSKPLFPDAIGMGGYFKKDKKTTYAPVDQGPQTLKEAMGKSGIGPPQQVGSGILQYPSGMKTWETGGGKYDGGTGVSYPNGKGQHPASGYYFFNRQGTRIDPTQD